ncbi:MAG: 6,7-dimethyl-8-ribityllumazine synthase [Candidatus Omnitrophota bacterium]|nr:MAG: 6,7-dimethyl-8-ribityllumazine synthase [Candidatus Omnitrophota bacterium]
MVKTIEAQLIAKGKKFGLIVSRFNDFISKRLLEAAVDTLIRHGALEEDLKVVWVPGAFELALAANQMAKTKKYDALICLAAIIRGGTPHFDYIAGETAKGIASVNLATGKPVSFGVITADNIEQAIERAGTKQGNKGADAALSAIEMANLIEKI